MILLSRIQLKDIDQVAGSRKGSRNGGNGEKGQEGGAQGE